MEEKEVPRDGNKNKGKTNGENVNTLRRDIHCGMDMHDTAYKSKAHRGFDCVECAKVSCTSECGRHPL